MDKPVALIKDRLAEAMKVREISAAELSKRTGISKSSLSHYINGRAKPKSDRIFLLARELNVDYAWLIGYDIPANEEGQEIPALFPVSADMSELNECLERISVICHLSEKETMFISFFLRLPEEKKKTIVNFFFTMVGDE